MIKGIDKIYKSKALERFKIAKISKEKELY